MTAKTSPASAPPPAATGDGTRAATANSNTANCAIIACM
eukprot:CAMPEP_0197696038 /NCGR_PEP_ID=MMETSP1338-20131121/116050_1 /TAXON_ID=43686 ORGANISM="Pelagodinium beii, Strain RCC1491" /NCGR_SAMPLE_ID=MMETSP1338 /ASSEMBLY_ACC=CAM_ASM_000754 /LENGTH=38 /DNA_ID= /DNA_START= /DNA_END= /DNA_ORIENTATION=